MSVLTLEQNGAWVPISLGAQGVQGPAGAAGHTPVKGTDYWTDADKAEIVNNVLAELPTWTGGSY